MVGYIAAQKIHIGEVQITGNDRTKTFVIERELLVAAGQSYASDSLTWLIDQSKNRVLNLNLFNTVEISLDEPSNEDSLLTVQISVVEKWFIWPIPFVEFSDRNFNVWGGLDFDPSRTNYGLYVFNYNLFGRNHTLKTKMKTGYNTKLGIEYRIPFLSRNTEWGINSLVEYSAQNEVWIETQNDSLQFYKNGQNNLVANTKAYVELTKRVTPYTRVYYGVSFMHGQLDSSVPQSDYFLNKLSYQRNYSAYVKIENDKRDNIFYPVKGTYSTARLETQLWQNNDIKSNLLIEGKLQKFSQLTKHIFSALALSGEYNSAPTAPYSERKMLGYDKIVRGYEHYVIDGTVGIRTNAALRYQVLGREVNLPFVPISNYQKVPLAVYVEVYTDAGYVSYSDVAPSNRLPNNMLYSVGVGLNTVVFNDRLLRLEYSLNGMKEGGFFVHFIKAI